MGKNRSIGDFMVRYLEDLVAIDCPLCRRNDTRQVGSRSRGGLAISSVICNGCGLIYLNPKPLPEKYSEFYATGDYRRFLNMAKGCKAAWNVDKYFTDEKFEKRKADGSRTAQEYFRGILGSGDLYFDFGCDSGGFMTGVMEETACDIMGNEPSEPCAAFIRKMLGMSVLNSTMEQISEQDRLRYRGKVKVASIIGTLEHVNDPIKCLSVANEMLAGSGYLYVESFDILKRMEKRREAVGDVATIDHQYYFHRDVYDYMLRLSGFEVMRLDYAGSEGKMMRVLARKTNSVLGEIGYDVCPLVEEVLRLNEWAERYRNSFSFKARTAVDDAKASVRWRGAAFLGKIRSRQQWQG